MNNMINKIYLKYYYLFITMNYSLFDSHLIFDFKKENTENIVFGDFLNETNVINWTIQDVYKWIMSLQMRRSLLIANVFKEEEIDGEALLFLTHNDISELFYENNLGSIGLFWLAIFKIQGINKVV
jgi:hypothetical protein